MLASSKLELRITLVLTSAEARWLKAIVQNPLHESETEQDADMRAKFFSAIDYAEQTPSVERE